MARPVATTQHNFSPPPSFAPRLSPPPPPKLLLCHGAPAGQQLLFVCNNDQTIQSYRVRGGVSPVSTIETGTAMNYCALSPDGRFLCCVGDDATTVLYQVTPSGTNKSL